MRPHILSTNLRPRVLYQNFLDDICPQSGGLRQSSHTTLILMFIKRRGLILNTVKASECVEQRTTCAVWQSCDLYRRLVLVLSMRSSRGLVRLQPPCASLTLTLSMRSSRALVRPQPPCASSTLTTMCTTSKHGQASSMTVVQKQNSLLVRVAHRALCSLCS